MKSAQGAFCVGSSGSTGDTIPNCLGELGEISERTGIAADGRQAGVWSQWRSASPAASEWSTVGRRRAGRNQLILSARIACFGDMLTKRGQSSRSGPVLSLSIRRSVAGSSQRGGRARPDPAGLAWGVGWENSGQVDLGGQPQPGFPGARDRVALPLSALICGPDGSKTPRKGVEKAVFSKSTT